MSATAFTGARVVAGREVLDPGWVVVRDGTIAEVGVGDAPRDGFVGDVVDLRGRWLLPGFVDLHVHGGGGSSITSGRPADAAAAIAFHRRHGTTTTLLSLVTAPLDVLERAIEGLATLVEADRGADGSVGAVAGVHLEGPFLSVDACGAQDPRSMCRPERPSVDRLLRAGRGTVRMVTLAPELPGGQAAVKRLVAEDVVVAVGHTRACFDEATAAFDAGATVATHIFNAMGPFHHRDPGTVGAALVHDRVIVELILDGHHVHPASGLAAIRAASSRRVALITDAVALAGCGDGDLDLGRSRVQVRDGVARLASDGSLAGSTLTMDAALRSAVDLGVDVTTASEMASATPARALGLDRSRGTIDVGKRADLVVLDEGLAVVEVYIGGVLVPSVL